ncbi:CYFA0S08e03620g1_1 [Cyberlindnera fabianii]|uniref:Acyl carrier protein n=1 Tax=Cyberlindnera fabianii TaxID=36022 RepID=A0A061AWS8_CYBFA|nr:Acyl carrier protein, mitochondrial [Cyberlindnera fabianii]CDR42101.1 CYFA0S08e03620g1_1 [Cyberlindnera fabianii]
MFRLASRSVVRASLSARVAAAPVARPAFLRFYSANSLSQDEIIRRIAESNAHLIKKDVTLSPELAIQGDLGLDSLDATEFLVNVENEFDFQLTDEESEKVKTIAEVVELVSSNPQAN